MANNVIFKIGTRAQYDALAVKDPSTLYWLSDVLELWKGDELYGKGAMATNLASGLMSPEDKAKLDSISAVPVNVIAGDASVSVTESDGNKLVAVQISKLDGNSLVVKDDGLFVQVPETVIPEYSIEKLEDDEYVASYRLKKVVGDEVSYMGDTINIPKDLVIKSGTVQTVTVENVPYEGAVVGDPYIDIVLSDAGATHIYIPAKSLVDTYTAGSGITIENNVVSLKFNPVSANGLFADADGVGLALATRESAGAMSAEDKLVVDSIPYVYEHMEYEISSKPEGTIVDYRDKEIRVMCPKDTVWTKQQSGEGADSNLYYIGFKAYAPNDNIVSFKEDLAETISDNTMYYFEGNDFAGIDEFGRKYSIVWLPVAAYDEASGVWSYYGAMSSDGKYIGWYYSVEWYNAEGVILGSDMIRISLSNEDCHYTLKPYYLGEYATSEELSAAVEELQSSVSAVEENFSWGDM